MIFHSFPEEVQISACSLYSSNLHDFSTKMSLTDQDGIYKSDKNKMYRVAENEQESRIISSQKSELIKRIKKEKKKNAIAPIQNEQPMRYCLTKVSKPIYTPYLFLFTGHVIVDFMDNVRDSEFTSNFKPLTIEQLEKRESTFSVKPSFIEVTKEFDMAIYLLENKQNQFQYNLAQIMKSYKAFATEQGQQINKIKEKYSNDFELLQELQAQRVKYRNDQIDLFIKENMKEDDFFFSFDQGIDFKNAVTCPHFLKMSKNTFAVFGIEEENVHIFLTKKEVFLQMMPDFSRKQLTLMSMQLMIQENKYNKIFRKNFEINTIDDIKMYCDVEAFVVPVQYPPHLEYISGQSTNIEDVSFIKFGITLNHLQYILSLRQGSNFQGEYSEDIEYSIFSQIFLEKFYPEELKLLNREMKEESSQSQDSIKSEDQKMEEEKTKQKTCGYRAVN